MSPQNSKSARNPSDQIPRAPVLGVLVLGFALVILLLLAAGYFGVRNIESIRTSVARLEESQALTARLLDELEGEQAALSAVFYKMARDPESVDREAILDQLEQTDRRIARIVSEVAGTPEEPLWKQLKSSSDSFTAEARRLLALEDAPTLLSRDLFHRHDQVILIVAKLIEATNRGVLEVQNQIRLRSRQLYRSSLVLLGACWLLALACAILTVRVTTDLFRKMVWQASELSRVSWHLLENQESAARRFSHELHDELGQSLTAVKANLLGLEPQGNHNRERLEDCIHLVDEALRNVRELSHLLRPTILDDFGLDASLRWLCERFTQRTGIEVEYGSNFTGRLSDETETHLFRIAQEALTNIARHSAARHVRMNLAAEGAKVRLAVEDNGRGLPADGQAERTGLGIVGMRARARSSGGQLTLRSANGQGLRIQVDVPVERVQDEKENPHLVG